MALILHIADLHLVAPESSPPIDDHKAGLVPAGARRTHHQALHLTMSRLGDTLVKDGRELDAIVVTGDIADKNNEGGYRAFLTLIEALGQAKPEPGRIVVLPGNHDVKRGLRAGDRLRYSQFVRFIRKKRFVTPWFTGLDPTPIPTVDAKKHLLDLDGIQIIPIDSSGYSQVKLDLGLSDGFWTHVEAAFAGTPDLRALKGLEIADAARVSGIQLEQVRDLLSRVSAGRRPLRIVATHHHLLPVSLGEEIKPFESLTDLALLREFLRDQEVSLVLHGHKHTEFTYVDHIQGHGIDAGPPSDVRVLSGAAASGLLSQTDVLRLLDVEPETGIVNVQRVPIAVPGARFSISNPEPLSFPRPGGPIVSETPGSIVINGTRVELVYHQLIARLVNRSGEADHVICRIEDSPELADIAKLYPGFSPGVDQSEPEVSKQRLEQFQDLVKWWQFPNAPLSPWEQPGFTHGNRIQRFNGHLNQLEEAIKTLAQDHGTTRGIVVLLSPEADKISQQEVPFPSFCLVQFKISGNRISGAPPTLDCTAYFRKQEMRYWWLVNLAELASLQRTVCESLRTRKGQDELRGIQPGPITTIAARAKAERTPPKVQVPRIDRYYSLSRERLFGMVNALLWEHIPGREQYAHDWMELFVELKPPETSDPDGLAIPHEGIKYIREEIEQHLESLQFQGDQQLSELRHVLDQLPAANREFALLQQKEDADSSKYDEWRNAVVPLVDRVVELTHGRISRTAAPVRRASRLKSTPKKAR